MTPLGLSFRVAEITAEPRWCGGLHRGHLRELLGCAYGELDRAIAIAYRRRAVDLCLLSWVVAPPLPAGRERAA
jgi:hypothetical protein